MRTVIFVETKFGLYFKCDTFWSQSEKPENAKIYSDNMPELKNWLQSILPSNIYEDRIEYVKDKYDGAKLGYFTIKNDVLFEGAYRLKDGTEIKDLGKPNYLWIIKMNDISNWVIKSRRPGKTENKTDRESIDVDPKSLGYFLDYKETHRNDVLNDVLNEKESE